VHHLQGKAELVNPTDLSLLIELHRDKLTLRERHVGVARVVGDYEFNNTYQYIINREDVHVSWLEAAIADLGGTLHDVPGVTVAPLAKRESFLPLVQQDARDVEALVAKWRARLADIVNVRHRTMIQVLLGETLEQKRFFDQMTAGRDDLLGRRSNGAGSPGTGDGVLGVRWLE
jgi:hypothetical protein